MGLLSSQSSQSVALAHGAWPIIKADWARAIRLGTRHGRAACGPPATHAETQRDASQRAAHGIADGAARADQREDAARQGRCAELACRDGDGQRRGAAPLAACAPLWRDAIVPVRPRCHPAAFTMSCVPGEADRRYEELLSRTRAERLTQQQYSQRAAPGALGSRRY